MTLRVMTYNVHRCVGTDRRLDPGRIADVIAAAQPDVVALQELDVGRARTGGVDQAHAIAQLLGMRSHFHAALKVEEERYGDAILTALPERLVRAGPLPGYPRIPGLEPRGALWVEVEKDGVTWQVINTHLGLVPKEQQVQAAALARDWLADARFVSPGVLLGDFNATPYSVAYKILAGGMSDAQKLNGKTPTACFPSSFPFLRIDHVFVTKKVKVTQVSSPFHAKSRTASDHLPLVVDLQVAAPSP